MGVIRDLIARFSIDPSGVKSGTDEIKARLTDLNKAFADNKREIKSNNDTIKTLEKEYSKLEKAMNRPHTKEQAEDFQRVAKAVDDARLKAASLATQQQDLRNRINATNKELKDHSKGFKEAEQGASSLKDKLFSVGGAMKTMLAGYTAKKLGEWLFGSTAELQGYEKSFEVFLKDAEKAKSLMAELTELSDTVPTVGVNVYASNAKMLLSYGVAVEDVKSKLSELSDLAGGNAETLDRVALAYGQMLAKGKVTGEELRQLTEAGVTLLQPLADTMGVTTDKLSEMISKGEVGISALDATIKTLTTGTGLYAGAAAAQLDTMDGKIASLKKQFEQLGREVGEESFGTLEKTLTEIMETLDEARRNGTIEEIANGLGDLLNTVVAGGIGAVKIILQFKEALVGVAVAYGSWKALTKGGEFIDAMASGIKQAYAAVVSLTTATKAQTTAQAASNAVTSANPYIALTSVILGVVAALGLLSAASENQFDELVSDTKELAKELKELEADVMDLNSENELEVRKRLSDAILSLADGKVSALELEKKSVEELIKAYKELNDEERKRKIEQLETEFKNKNSQLAYDLRDMMNYQLDAMIGEGADYSAIEDVKKLIDELQDSDDGLTAKRGLEAYLEQLNANGEGASRNAEAIAVALSAVGLASKDAQKAENALYEVSDEKAAADEARLKNLEDQKKKTEELTTASEETTETLQDLATATSTLSSVMAEQEKNGQISAETFLKIKEAGYSAAVYIDEATGVFKLNINVLKDLSIEQLKAKNATDELALSQAQLAYDTLRVNSALDAQRKTELGDMIKQYEEEIAFRKAFITQQQQGTGSFAPTTTTTTTTKVEKTEFQTSLSDLKYNLDMEYITQKQYYDRLEKLNEQHNKNNLDLYRQYEVEIKKGRDSALKGTKSTNEKALDDILKGYTSHLDEMKKARNNAKQDEDLQKQLDAINARLEYEQMDDFSRYELEKKRKEIQQQQEDVAFDRMIDGKKAEADTRIAELKSQIDLTSQDTTKALASVNSMLSNMQKYSQNITNNKTVTYNSNSFSMTNPYYTIDQIADKIIKRIGG